jgi:hypothetical protein
VSGPDVIDLAEPLDERFVGESCLAVEDLPDWPDDYDAFVTAQIAAAHMPAAEEVVAGEVVSHLERSTVDQAMLCRLAGVDPLDLDDDGLVGYAVAWSRVMSHAAGEIARAVVGYHDRVSRDETLGATRLTAAEFGVALRLGAGAADQLVHTSLALSRRLPATFAAVSSGDVSWAKAVALAERTVILTPEKARQVEDVVLPRAAERTPARHADAVRRAVDRIDPDGAAARRRRAEKDIALVRAHVGDGMGELFARLPSEQLDTVWTAADAWARRAKAAATPGTLDQLRVQALVRWAESFLTHGDSSGCDVGCDVGCDPSVQVAGGSDPPTRHGRPVKVRAIWDLHSLLGLADRPGELADSGATLTASTMRGLVDSGATVRRLLIDDVTGELLDLTPDAYPMPVTDGRAHRAPVELHVTIGHAAWRHIQSDPASPVAAAIAAAPAAVRSMLAAPVTAPDLDSTPCAYPPPAHLADFVATRDRHPTNPCAGRSAAHAADLDHTVPVSAGGKTVRDNLTSLTRRWHRLRTLGGWTVERIGRQWRWTSRTGRTITTAPHDYRLGP